MTCILINFSQFLISLPACSEIHHLSLFIIIRHLKEYFQLLPDRNASEFFYIIFIFPKLAVSVECVLIKKDIKLASLFHFLRSVITKYKLKRPLSGFPAGFHLWGGSSLGVGGLRVIKGVGGSG